MNNQVKSITERIIKRSAADRKKYLDNIDVAQAKGPIRRSGLSCSNLAHGFAACGAVDKERLSGDETKNIGIVTAYNDMLSAHQPYARYPEIIKQAVRDAGATAQVAGGTPAMCDGVTQGQVGMELSLFSRDVIAMSTAVGLSHDMFDGVLLLGICDKIVPGLMIGALGFGHLPMLFVPGGPMPSGLPNKEKAKVRQEFAKGNVTRIELLKAESASYHSPGTCTFYGTANSNQMFMEIMGLHLPGGTFINPEDPRRDLLTAQAATKVVEIAENQQKELAIGKVVDEKAIINAIIGLLATGGSTNHTIHLVAIAKAAGISVDWQDFDDLSSVIPLLARVYPNGQADVNHFRDAGGIGYVIHELTSEGLLHDDVTTICGKGLRENYLVNPELENNSLSYKPIELKSKEESILRSVKKPFEATGGIRLLEGNLGRSIIKISAVPKENRVVKAPALVCDSQEDLREKLGSIKQDLVAIVRFQGAKANGMPELHKLTPALAILQEQGHKVALVTDGRMSGASGVVPAAIHLSPEALDDGPIAKIKDGDVICLDAEKGTLNVEIDEASFATRKPASLQVNNDQGCGRELFTTFRSIVTTPEQGATVF